MTPETLQKVAGPGLVGIVLCTVGYLVRFRHRYDLIAGYDPRNSSPRVGNWIGGGALILGGVLIAAAIMVSLG